MESSLSFRFQDGKIHFLEEEIESWKRDHANAMAAGNLEDMVAECLSLWESLERLWQRVRKLAKQNRLRAIQQHGEGLLNLFERLIALLREVEKIGSLFARQEYAIDGLQELPGAITSAEALRDHIREIWPWDSRPILPLNREMVEQSRKSVDKAVSVEEILAQLGYQPGSR